MVGGVHATKVRLRRKVWMREYYFRRFHYVVPA